MDINGLSKGKTIINIILYNVSIFAQLSKLNLHRFSQSENPK